MRSSPILSTAQSEARLSEFATEVLKGLSSRNKSLPCRFLYDAKGSELFEAITYTSEYYVTRTEISLLKNHAEEIAAIAGDDAQLIEFGSGSSRKTKYLIEALENINAYVPIDISISALAEAKKDLQEHFPALTVNPVHADFTQKLDLPSPASGSKRLGFFPGSTLGNFSYENARKFLQTARDILGPDSGLVIGIDLPKDPAILIPAYDDAEGISAAFNLNILTRINRELEGAFDLSKFEHVAEYDADKSCMELFLKSKEEQEVSVLDTKIHFQENETIHTESSHKYAINSFKELAENSGWKPLKCWTDSKNLFSIHYLLPK